MYDEADLLPISALQHLAFCERQWALIHLERLWAENPLTVEGHHLHDRTHEPETESRGDLRIARGLRLRSLRLGLSGIADVVEFRRLSGNEVRSHSEPSAVIPSADSHEPALTTAHDDARSALECGSEAARSCRLPLAKDKAVAGATALQGASRTFAGRSDSEGLGTSQAGVSLPGVRGLWQPAPVEYKRGRPKLGPYDEIQLCAQALCLEEMLGVAISAGALYYGQPHQRQEVALTGELREQTEKLATRLHELTRIGRTPLASYEKKCESCSLLALCMPKTTGGRKSVDRYLASMLEHEGLPPPADGWAPGDS
jgi:CRISPR/Cas system-associated exonuclease Cas4 (RecB family)